MDFLLGTLINIEYFIYFVCIGDYYFSYNRRHYKYEKILLLLIATLVSVLWEDLSVLERLLTHISSIFVVIMVYFQEKRLRLLVLYLSVLTLLAMIIPMFELLVEVLLYFGNVKMNDNVIGFWGHTLLLAYLWIISEYFKKKFVNAIGKIEKVYLLFLTIVLLVDSIIVSILGRFVQTNEQVSQKPVLILAYVFIVIGILIQLALLMNAVITRNISKENEILAKQFLDSQKEHYEYLEKREMETKKFRHDIRNHLIVVRELLHNKDYEEVDKYLYSINENVNRFSSYISVNNGIADAIINKFYYEAKKKGIIIQVKGHFPLECYVSAYDICTILSNLLSNALIAVSECEQRKDILLDIRYTEQDIIIVVENDYEHELKVKGNVFITTKKDTYNHGLGLENVKRCVERNNGHFTISTENKRFKVMLSIGNDKGVDDENCGCG